MKCYCSFSVQPARFDCRLSILEYFTCESATNASSRVFFFMGEWIRVCMRKFLRFEDTDVWILKPIGSMGLVYLPTFSWFLWFSCRWIYNRPMDPRGKRPPPNKNPGSTPNPSRRTSRKSGDVWGFKHRSSFGYMLVAETCFILTVETQAFPASWIFSRVFNNKPSKKGGEASTRSSNFVRNCLNPQSTYKPPGFFSTQSQADAYLGVPKDSGTPKWMVKIMENPIF